MRKRQQPLWTNKKWRRLLGVVISLILTAAMAVSIITEGFEMPFHLVSCVLLILIIPALFFGFKMNKAVSVIFMVLTPAFCFYALEGYSHAAWKDISVSVQMLNLAVYYLIFLLLFFISGRGSAAAVLTSIFMMAVGLINYYVVAFRDTPVVPWDLMSLSTALSVTKNYVFSISGRVIMVTFFFVWVAVTDSRISFEMRRSFRRLAAVLAAVVISGAYVFILQTPRMIQLFELDETIGTLNDQYERNGLTVSFLSSLRYIRTERPSGYSESRVQEIIDETYEKAGQSNRASQNDVKPNIIVIMNESFADMGDIAQFSVNEDYMPFVHSMLKGEVENCVSGKLISSVLGGNTANSEFEFLTGDTMAFLPPGSIAYQQYVKDSIPNLVTALKENEGYTVTAMHPYYAAGWNRDKIYPLLGFEQTYFLEDMLEMPWLERHTSYIRDYISDQSLMDMIRDMYENKAEDQPAFTFAVTMQNHGGYFDDFENFQPEIELLNVEDDYNKDYLNRYLSLIKASDDAFENLIGYFENYEEPTIIVMFGDHQPGDYVIHSIYDTEKERSSEEMAKRYMVPFVMWANYDIEDEQIDTMSINYLSTLLMEKAGLPMTGYQTFLSQLRQSFPVISANVIIDKDGKIYAGSTSAQRSSAYKEMLGEYAVLQYNHLFDTSHRQEDFFNSSLKPE